MAEIGTLAQMRHLSALTVDASFPGDPPAVGHLPGASAVQVVGRHLTCQVIGPEDTLLGVIAAAHPSMLLSREPSLEELFLSLYGSDEMHRDEIGSEVAQ